MDIINMVAIDCKEMKYNLFKQTIPAKQHLLVLGHFGPIHILLKIRQIKKFENSKNKIHKKNS